MLDFLLFLSIIFPGLAAIVAYMDKSNNRHQTLIKVTGGVLTFSALALALSVPDVVTFSGGLPSILRLPILILDFVLLGIILYIGWQRNHTLIMGLAVAQLAGMFILEVFMHPETQGSAPAFTLDSLGIILVLVVSVIGSLIAYYALGYMKEHEEHLHLQETRQPRFFAVIFLFLGAMNGLALSDDLSWVYFFWEVTTLCSFLLIGHDDTEEANANADRALWMNMAGGAAFVLAMLWLQQSQGTLSLTALMNTAAGGGANGFILFAVVLLCFAGFTKSAQLPFQSWLCGAMVAPTPVSALLHSSTMVKAGVFLVLRLAPLYAGTAVSTMVAICGGFTFIVTAALAAGQSNGKKILAYSTISNLGLIIACAGINTAASLAAGMLLLIFHAISKGLLFLCVGTIEQKIGSRDIEDMRGLFQVMPRTAMLTTFGIISMMLPPFGMLLAKWMALESSVEASAMPVLVIMLALGSGLTVLFWARWAGILLGSANPRLVVDTEEQDSKIGLPLRTLATGAAVLSFFAPLLYVWLVQPAVAGMLGVDAAKTVTGTLFYETQYGGLGNSYGIFAVYPLYAIIALGFWYAWRAAKRHAVGGPELPYMSGIQAREGDKIGFIGPMKGFVETQSGNYYLNAFFGEDKISRPANIAALALLAMLLGGVLQ